MQYCNQLNRTQLKRYKLKALVSLVVIVSAINIGACSSEVQPSEPFDSLDKISSDESVSLADPQQTIQSQVLTTIDTLRGPVTLPQNPHPLVVYDLTVLQNLIALGVTVEGIPNHAVVHDIMKQRLANAKNSSTVNLDTEELGTVFEPDLESLDRIQPQAIIIGNRMVQKYDALSSIAPTLDLSVSFADLYASSQQQLSQLGKLFGKSEQAQKLQAEIDQAIESTSAITRNKGNGLVIAAQGNTITTFGLNSRYGYLHQYFGVAIADPDLGSYVHGQPISFEYIRQVDPDWLFLLEHNAKTHSKGKNAYALLNNALIHQTKAWRKQHIVYLSADSYLAFGSYDHWINDAKRIQAAFKDAPDVSSAKRD